MREPGSAGGWKRARRERVPAALESKYVSDCARTQANFRRARALAAASFRTPLAPTDRGAATG